MTGTIHMQTEQIRASASLLKNKSLVLNDQLSTLQQAASRLQSSWQDASSDQFFAELAPLASSLRQ